MLKALIIILLIVLLLFAIIKAPAKTIKFIGAVGKKTIELFSTIVKEGKPVVQEIMKNETTKEK